jgi:hypothetical protein
MNEFIFASTVLLHNLDLKVGLRMLKKRYATDYEKMYKAQKYVAFS